MEGSRTSMPSRDKTEASALRALDRLYNQMLLDVMRCTEHARARDDSGLLERAQHAVNCLCGEAAKIKEEIADKIRKACPHEQVLMKRSLSAALDYINISEGLVDKYPDGWRNLVDEIIELPLSLRLIFRDLPRQEYIIRFADPEALTRVRDFAEVLWASEFSPTAVILISPNEVPKLKSLDGIIRAEPAREATFFNEATV